MCELLAQGGRDRWISASLRSAWSTEGVPCCIVGTVGVGVAERRGTEGEVGEKTTMMMYENRFLRHVLLLLQLTFILKKLLILVSKTAFAVSI